MYDRDKANHDLINEIMELKQEFHYINAINHSDAKKREQMIEELATTYTIIATQNEEIGKRAAELIIANLELDFQTEEKKKRAAELVIANIELAFQNKEKAKRAAELILANKELFYQNEEKEKRIAELAKIKIKLEMIIGQYRDRELDIVNFKKEINDFFVKAGSVPKYIV